MEEEYIRLVTEYAFEKETKAKKDPLDHGTGSVMNKLAYLMVI
jgi:hypothetical protein